MKKILKFLRKLLWMVLILAMIAIASLEALIYFDVIEMPSKEDVVEWVKNLKMKFERETEDSEQQDFQNLTGGFTDRKIIDEKSALAAIEDMGDVIGIGNVQEELTNCRTDVVFDNAYYRFQQEYEGIPIYGRNVIVSADKDGNSLSLTGNYLDHGDTELEVTPKINEEEAVEIAQKHGGDDAQTESYGLTFYPLGDNGIELAWQIYVNNHGQNEYCFVSAMDGDIIRELSLTYTERVLCNGIDKSGENREFYAEYEAGKYYMQDVERDINIYNANNREVKREEVVEDSDGKIYKSYKRQYYMDENKHRVDIDENNGNGTFVIKNMQGEEIGNKGVMYLKLWTSPTAEQLLGKLEMPTSESEIWTAKNAVTLMSGLSVTYDFWKSEFNRESYDNRCGGIYAVYNNGVHGRTGNNSYSEYGNNGQGSTLLCFETSNSLSVDIIAHEFMHSVERSISAMSYEAESGALMEAYSDIFGEVVEDWSLDEELKGKCDWENDFRNMVSPEKSNNGKLPSRYQGENWEDTSNTKIDHGYVHTNCTVISHAAYLMQKGFNGIDALSMKDLAALFYETLFSLPSDCTFEQFRSLLQNRADIMCAQGRLSEDQRHCVSYAMFQTGIESSAVFVDKDNLTIKLYDVSNQDYDNYTLYVKKGNSKEEKYSGKEIKENGILFGEGEYQLRFVDNKNTDNVTEISVVAVKKGGAKEIPIWTEFGTTNGLVGSGDQTDSAYEQYVAAAKKTTQAGSWSEKMNMEADMMVTQDRVKVKTKAIMNIDSDITDYAEDDLSRLKVSARAEMEAAKQIYTWNIDYHDGVAYYQLLEPKQQSYSMEINPNIYNFKSVSQDTILEEKISNGKLRFLLDGDKVVESGLGAIQQMNGVDKMKCGDIEMIVTLTEEGTIDQVEMNFDASIEYMGYDADAAYKLTYSFRL